MIRTDTDQLQFSAYVIRYRLDLWSTFTYFLRDPLKGDQMLQHDDRAVFGFKGSKTWNARIGEISLSNVIGAQARIDDIYDVGIFSTYQRRTIGTMQNAGVVESNGAFYAQSSVQWRDHWRTVVGLRADQFEFDVKDKMLNAGNCNIQSDPQGCVTGQVELSVSLRAIVACVCVGHGPPLPLMTPPSPALPPTSAEPPASPIVCTSLDVLLHATNASARAPGDSEQTDHRGEGFMVFSPTQFM